MAENTTGQGQPDLVSSTPGKKNMFVKKSSIRVRNSLVDFETSMADTNGNENGEFNHGDFNSNEHSILEKFKERGSCSSEDAFFDVMLTLLAGKLTCLVCIENIEHNEATWNCSFCFRILHLNCVGKWAKDSLFQRRETGDGMIGTRSWSCPNCRAEHIAVPQQYLCFCSKQRDPEFDKWLCPHSCGEPCGRSLRPTCGHKCALPCHPGPCSDCPATITAACFCGKSKTTKRCSHKHWSCRTLCSKYLACGLHSCNEVCHPGSCPPCSTIGQYPCNCGAEVKKIVCSESDWHCSKPCRRKLNCGIHFCEGVCHKDGECRPCPNSGKRLCPCGKKTYTDIGCASEDLPTCVNTCGKLLNCGLHSCWQKCHTGDCQDCLESVKKTCRCGEKTRLHPCVKDFVCETKCGRQRVCGHSCKRKCCSQCPPCTFPCNKKLQCGNHKCQSLCHLGPCFPCKETKMRLCFCGKTSASFPCGTALKDSVVICRELCAIPPKCHHERLEDHFCHDGRCPTCRLKCDKRMTCSHKCEAKCHSAVLTKMSPKGKPKAPWESQTQTIWKYVDKSCPECKVPVNIDCFGGHGETERPCHLAVKKTCGQECGRLLPCKTHRCRKECHVVHPISPNESDAGSNCDKSCGQLCPTKGRPNDCLHPCPRACHSGDCSPCNQYITIRCHCSNTVTVKSCQEWCLLTEDERSSLKTCLQRCTKDLRCGHRCFLSCHDGSCGDPSLCTRKMTLYCLCKRLREDTVCSMLASRNTSLECDETCRNIINQKEAFKAERQAKEDAERKRLEDERNIEEISRVLGNRKKKPGKKKILQTYEPNAGNGRSLLIILSLVFTVVVSVLIFHFGSS